MKNSARYLLLFLPLFGLLLAGCGPDVPSSYAEGKEVPRIAPDYSGVTVPSNIAPLRFLVCDEAEEYVTRFRAADTEVLCSGAAVKPGLDDWRDLLAAAKGGDIEVEVYARRDGRWTRFRPFAVHVAEEPIDPWLSYRLIAPSYVTYEALTINQRDLTSFAESEIYNNQLGVEGSDGQCINCHAYQNYSPDNMQFHARQTHGGTMLVVDGELKKVDLKADSSVISAGVYPSWHPKERLIAYSVNTTGQSFHTKDLQKVEVQDSHSDLILYDVEANTVRKIAAEPDELETFPWWSPEGDYLYFCSARYHYDPEGGDRKLMDDYQTIRYNVYRMAYDHASGAFGPRELVFDADSMGRSATMPRAGSSSPLATTAASTSGTRAATSGSWTSAPTRATPAWRPPAALPGSWILPAPPMWRPSPSGPPTAAGSSSAPAATTVPTPGLILPTSPLTAGPVSLSSCPRPIRSFIPTSIAPSTCPSS